MNREIGLVPQVPTTEQQIVPKGRSANAQGIVPKGRSSYLNGEPVSSPSAYRQIHGLFSAYAPLGYMLPWETLDYVELLSTYNPDYSQAVENIKMLANTGHTLIVDAQSELRRNRLISRLNEKARTIQEPHGGVDGVIDKLMDQAATYGAMAGEWVMTEDMTDVVDFVDINPKNIRFFWEDDVAGWAPYQKVSGNQAESAKSRGQKVINNCVRLNPLTFRYYAFDAAPESPYGTPPFLAALTNIAIQRDLVANMAQIVKKIGLLGIIDLTIERLDPKPGESDEQYQNRARQYLEEYTVAAEEMAREGGLIHFDDVSVTTQQIGGNAAGATNIHKANEEMVFSGLKSMPSVQGRSYSTTETYAGVAYDIIIRNTRKYQRAAKRVLESGYWLMAAAWGENPNSIRIVFNENRSINRLQEASAEKVEIANTMMKWIMGIIDQMDAAQELGYSSPKRPMDEPPEAVEGNLTAHGVDDPGFDFPARPSSQGNMEESHDEA